jgi:hypothetical protein
MIPKKKEWKLPHESSSKDEGKEYQNLKIEKSNLEKGDCSDNRAPIKVEVEINIKPYVGDMNTLKLNQWIQQWEFYFIVHEVNGAHTIYFSHLKMECHTLTLWESDVVS